MAGAVSRVEGFVVTTAITKLRKLTARVKVIPGGTSAGKTYGIIPLLIDYAARNAGTEISIVSESVPHLRKGALKDFIKIMQATGRWIDANYNRTMLIYTFSNGSYIEFFSADQEDKVRGPRRHILYVNECNNISFETYHQLAIRTSVSIWLDFNPSNEFWAYTELKEDEDTQWLTLTYKDNEALAPSIRKEIEKAKVKAYHDPNGNIQDEKNIKNKYWANWWRVYGLGQLGSLEGVIFSNWSLIDEIPKDARLIGSGLDFGFSNDPTTVVDVYQWGSKRILDERCYQTGLLNPAIAELLHMHVTTWADSAEPKSIEEIKGYKIPIKGAKKGKDSIVYGIQVMQQQDYLVTRRSTNLIKELRSYCWDVDRNGNKLNVPAGGFDHCVTGDTLVRTFKGEKPISLIKPGDFILTRQGYKPLIRKWDNGHKQVRTYAIRTPLRTIRITATADHKIQTDKGWLELSELRKRDTICLSMGSFLWEAEVTSISCSKPVYRQVFDLSVSEEHEYFAGGVLIHNCIDAVRYHEVMSLGKKNRKAKFGWN